MARRTDRQARGSEDPADLKAREYVDEGGNVRHHTHTYMEQQHKPGARRSRKGARGRSAEAGRPRQKPSHADTPEPRQQAQPAENRHGSEGAEDSRRLKAAESRPAAAGSARQATAALTPGLVFIGVIGGLIAWSGLLKRRAPSGRAGAGSSEPRRPLRQP